MRIDIHLLHERALVDSSKHTGAAVVGVDRRKSQSETAITDDERNAGKAKSLPRFYVAPFAVHPDAFISSNRNNTTHLIR